jgi:hypothetical protein
MATSLDATMVGAFWRHPRRAWLGESMPGAKRVRSAVGLAAVRSVSQAAAAVESPDDLEGVFARALDIAIDVTGAAALRKTGGDIKSAARRLWDARRSTGSWSTLGSNGGPVSRVSNSSTETRALFAEVAESLKKRSGLEVA